MGAQEVELLSKQAELMERMNSLITMQTEKLTALANAQGTQSRISQDAAAAVEAHSSSMQGAGESAGTMEEQFSKLQGTFSSFTDKIKSFVGEGVFNSFNDALKLTGLNISSLTDIISNPLSAALGMLGEVWRILTEKAALLYKDMLRLAETMERVREKFGSFNENTSRRTIAAFRELGSTIKSTGENAAQFGRKFSPGVTGSIERLELMMEVVDELGPTIDLLGQQFNDAADQMFLLKKGLNFSGEALKQTAVLSQLAGKSLSGFSNEIMGTINKIGKNFGVSTKVLGADVGKALSNFKMLGKMTGDYVKEITKAAVFTRKLGIEINELTGLVDKFDEFEGGAEAAAQLAQGFGMVIDPLKMMGMEVGPRLQELQRAFMATGRSIDSMSRQERKLLADTAGLTEEQALLAFSSKGMSMSYDEIAAGAESATRKQKTSQEIIADTLDNIKNVIVGFESATGFITAFFEGFGIGLMRGGLMGLLMQLAKQMGKVYHIGIEVGSIFGRLFGSPKTKEEAASLTDRISKIGDMFVTIAAHVREFSKAIFSEDGKLKLDTVGEHFKNFVSSIFGVISGTFKSATGGIDVEGIVKSVGLFVFEILTGALDWLAGQIPVWTEKLTEIFTDEEDGLAGGTRGAFEAALDKLKGAADRLLDEEKLSAFFKAAGQALVRFLNKFPIATLMAGLFVAGGPISTIVTGIFSQFFGSIGNTFSQVGAGAASAPMADAARAAATNSISGAAGNAIIDGATKVVSAGQGILDKLFNLIKDPAKIVLMAGAIAESIKILGEAVLSVMRSFMDPLPNGDGKTTFIDLVVESAKKFSAVSFTDLLSLGGVLAAVGLAVGGLAGAISIIATKASPMQLMAGAAGALLASYVAGSAAGSGVIGTFLGGIGNLLKDIAEPFQDTAFLVSLQIISTMTGSIMAFANSSGSIAAVIGAIAKMHATIPRAGILGSEPDVTGIQESMEAIRKIIIGDSFSESIAGKWGLARLISKMPPMDDLVGKSTSFSSLAEIVSSLGSAVASLSNISEIESATENSLKLVGLMPSLGTLSAVMRTIFGGPNVIGPEVLGSITSMRDTTNMIGELNDGLDNIIDFTDGVERITTRLTEAKMEQFSKTLTGIVGHVKMINEALRDLDTIGINATIDRVGSNMKIAKQSLQIAGGAVQVNVQLNLTVNTEKMAQALVLGGFVSPSTGYKEALQTDYMDDNRFDGLNQSTLNSLSESGTSQFIGTSQS